MLVSEEVSNRGLKAPTEDDKVQIRTDIVTELLIMEEGDLIKHLLKLQGEKVETFEIEEFELARSRVTILDEQAFNRAMEMMDLS